MNRLIMVTGASIDSDIGHAICHTLAAEGATLILVGRREKPLISTAKTLTGTHFVEAMDLTQLDKIPIWLTKITNKYGKLNGIIHSASFQGYTPLKGLKAKHIHQYLDINLSAALMLTSAFAKPQNHLSPSYLIYIGSVAGFRGLKGRCLYAASKAALNSITQSCALELAEKNITVNCVAPGLVDGAKAKQQLLMISDKEQQKLQASQPLGLVPAKKVADTVSFLISDKASHITGTTITVDAGYLAG